MRSYLISRSDRGALKRYCVLEFRFNKGFNLSFTFFPDINLLLICCCLCPTQITHSLFLLRGTGHVSSLLTVLHLHYNYISLGALGFTGLQTLLYVDQLGQ
jgi:hypothetical protein